MQCSASYQLYNSQKLIFFQCTAFSISAELEEDLCKGVQIRKLNGTEKFTSLVFEKKHSNINLYFYSSCENVMVIRIATNCHRYCSAAFPVRDCFFNVAL